MTLPREGNVIDLGFTKLQVVEACSGLHSIISLMILGFLLIYFIKTHFWKRAVIFISTIPLSIITNSLRITLTSILYKYWGSEVAQGFFHGFSGLLIFITCIPILFIEIWILEKLPPFTSSQVLVKSDSTLQSSSGTSNLYDMKRWGRETLFQPVFIVAVILFCMTLFFSQSNVFSEKIPINKPFSQFPLKVGKHSADFRQPMEQIYIDSLDLSDYLIIDYRDNLGKKVNFYVAYYESQKKGESIHSPATCLPGGGWDFKQSGTITAPISSKHRDFISVNRAFMVKGRQKQVTYYWYEQRGRTLTNAYQLKIFNFWDSITMRRTDGALVRLITPVYDSEKIEETETRLQNFVKDISRVLEEYIPGKDLY